MNTAYISYFTQWILHLSIISFFSTNQVMFNNCLTCLPVDREWSCIWDEIMSVTFSVSAAVPAPQQLITARTKVLVSYSIISTKSLIWLIYMCINNLGHGMVQWQSHMKQVVTYTYTCRYAYLLNIRCNVMNFSTIFVSNNGILLKENKPTLVYMHSWLLHLFVIPNI